MSVIIPRGIADQELRAIPIMLVQEDGVTPANVSVTGVKPQIRRVGTAGSFAAVSQDLHPVNAAAGEYEVRLTQAEASQDSGNYRGLVPATGEAIQMPFTFQIGPPDVFEDPATIEDIATANREEMDTNSTQLDIPNSASLFPEITNEGARTIIFRDKDGNVVAQGTFNRDNVSRLPFVDIDPDLP